MEQKCKICNTTTKSMKSLKTHLTKKHNVEFKEYYDRFLKVDEYDGICKLCKVKETRFVSYKGEYNLLCEKCGKSRSIEALKILYGEEEGIRRYEEYCKGCSHDLNFFIDKYGKEDGTRLHKNWVDKTRNTKENYINRYGVEEGTLRHEEYCKSKVLSEETFVLKYGEEEGIRRYKKWTNKDLTMEGFIKRHGEVNGPILFNEWKEKIKNTKENFILRHGEEEGIKRYEEYCTKVGPGKANLIRVYGEEEGLKKYKEFCDMKSGCLTEEWFIEKYGEEDGISEFELFKEKSKQTLYNFIDRYGEEIGRKRFEEFCIKSSNNAISISKESISFFYILIDWLFENSICEFRDLKLGIPESKEMCLTYNYGRNWFLYDFTIFDKLIIEYNGSGSHVRNSWSEEKKLKWKHIWKKNLSYEDILKKDTLKEKLAIDNGYKILHIWSEDDIEYNLNLCKKFILDNNL